MEVWYTSDWHLGHLNIIRFDQRPFHSLQEMADILVQNYNALVGPKDVVYFVGDMGWGKTLDLANALARMNGFKILIPGNHDNKLVKGLFDLVQYKAVVEIGGQLVSISHCPLMGVKREDWCDANWHGEDRLGKIYSVEDKGQFHLHGHIHSDQFNKTRGRQFDVGVRANDYFPVSGEEIANWIKGQVKQKGGLSV